MKTIFLDDKGLTIEHLAAVARKSVRIKLLKKTEKKVERAAKLVEKWLAQGKRIYGVTTGFGALSDVAISSSDAGLLQQNILMSHAAGVGNPLPSDVVRAAMALRVKDSAKGHSGLRLETINHLIKLLNADICPIIPEKGSVGASGDLAPLAHMAIVLIGLGEAMYKGKQITGKSALAECGLKPLKLKAGEGLALVNGTQVMTGESGLIIHDAIQLSKMTDIAAAMTLEVLMGSRTEFDPRIHRLRPHTGQIASADNMLRMTKNSEIISSHKDCSQIQDAYTLRCSPQVHGASKDMIAYAHKIIETEMNAATGNPLIFPEDDDYLLGGNFHGQPVAMVMDALAIAIAELASISERRIERLVNPQLSGLPAFLIADGGLHSGFMIAQYTAASLVSENKVLAHPACVDSIPTSANKEDHVSMGSISVRKCREILKNTELVLAIELLCAAQAMDLFTNMKAGEGSRAAYKTVRSAVPHLDKDRVLSKDIEAMHQLMRSGKIIQAVEKKVSELL